MHLCHRYLILYSKNRQIIDPIPQTPVPVCVCVCVCCTCVCVVVTKHEVLILGHHVSTEVSAKVSMRLVPE